MKLKRTFAGVVIGALVLAACGTGSESSDTTERTRNTAISSPFANKILFVSGDDSSGNTKIHQYVFNSSGVPTMTELYSTTAGGNVGITGIAYDAADNKLYWTLQEDDSIKVKVMDLDSAVISTLYTVGGGYPYGLAYDPIYRNLMWSGQTTSPSLWRGDLMESPVSVLSTGTVHGLSAESNTVYGHVGSSIYRFIVAGRTRIVETTTNSDAWATLIDASNSHLYYTTDFVGGSNDVMRSVPSETDIPVRVATLPRRIMSMALLNDRSLLLADGPRPSLGDTVSDSVITWVSATDPTNQVEFVPTSPLKITSIWAVEAPFVVVDPEIEGDGIVNTEYFCNSGSWNYDIGGMRSSGNSQNGSERVKWYLNGAEIDGATDWSYTPTQGGRIKCVVTVNNIVGSASASSLELDVIDPSATTTTTIEPSGSGSGDSATSPTTPSIPGAVAYKSISVKWSYSSSKKVLTGTFKKVSGARTYTMTLTGATKKTVKCTTSGTKVTCRATLKRGSNVITVQAKNASKVIVAQRIASKRVR